MIPTTYGDMSRHLMLGRHAARLKASITDLSKEMTTGIVSDKARHLRGDVTLLAGLERNLELATTRKYVGQNAGQMLAAQQTVLGSIRTRSEDIFVSLLQTEMVSSDAHRTRTISALESLFNDTVNLLNTDFAGRSLFGGTAGGGPALASADVILAALAADLPVGLDSVRMSAHVDAWFADGGGFDTVGYLGGSAIPAALDVGGGIEMRFEITAQATPLRQTLAGLAKGALLARGVFDASPAAQAATLSAASMTMATSIAGLVDISARVGIEEEKAARATSQAEAEHTAMGIARAELLSVDPYDAATKLEHAMSQLDLVYNITARLSRLTLADYLR